MAPPTKEFTSSGAPPQDDRADVGAVAVRSDHWKAIVDFLSVQSSVLNAAVPEHIYGLQAEAHRRYKALEPMLNKYNLPDDMVEVTVTLDHGDQQKVRISPEALTWGVNHAGDPNNNGTVKDEKATETNTDIGEGFTAQQPKTTTKQDLKSIETSKASSAKQTGSNTAGSFSTSSSRQSNASTSATNKRTASASQATAELSGEASCRAASKPKQKTACVSSSSDKPQNDVATPAIKPDMRNASKKPNRTQVVQPKKPNPFQINQAQEPKSATRKTPKNSNIPEPGKVVKSETFTFVKNSSREQRSFVCPDTPPKSTQPSGARKTYSETTSAAGQKSADAGTKVDVGPHAVLKDKTNKGKAPPKAETKASAKTSTNSQLTKPVIKLKAMPDDDKVTAADPKPAGAKRPRSSDDAYTNERPTKKLATQQTLVLDIDVSCQLEVTRDEGISPGSLSSPTEAEKTPAQSCTSDVDTKLDPPHTKKASTASVATTDPRELEQNEAAPNSDPSNPSVEDSSKFTASIKPDEAPTSARAKDISAKQEAKTSKTSHRTPIYTSEAPEEQKGVAKVVKRAPKRARDRADDLIDDTSDEEDAKHKRKVKKTKRPHDEDMPQRESVGGFEENDEGSTYAPRKLRTARKSRTIPRSPTESLKSHDSEDNDEKYKKDESLDKENKQNGLVLEEPRQRRALSSAPSTPSTSSSPSRPTGSSKRTNTPASSSISERSDASNSATASPQPTSATLKTTTSAPVKRKQDDTASNSQPPKKKRKLARKVRVVATATPRPSPAERMCAEGKAKKLIEQRTGQPAVDYSSLKSHNTTVQ